MNRQAIEKLQYDKEKRRLACPRFFHVLYQVVYFTTKFRIFPGT